MGYTTKFNGQFRFSKLPTAETIVKLRALENEQIKDKDSPGGYCQWQLTKDCQGLEWDGGEKFYDYVEWAQWLYDKFLKPDGIAITGTVKFRGDDNEDCGCIRFNGKQFIKDTLTYGGTDADVLAALKTLVKEVECYCCDTGVSAKGPCGRCVAAGVLKAKGE